MLLEYIIDGLIYYVAIKKSHYGMQTRIGTLRVCSIFAWKRRRLHKVC